MRPIKKYIILGVVAFILILASVTNPNKTAYVSYVKDKMNEDTTNPFEAGLVNMFVGPAITSTTHEKNFVFFSLYTTNLDDTTIEAIGVFDHFLLVKPS